MISIALSPKNKLYVEGDSSNETSELEKAFAKGTGHGLLYLDTVSFPMDDVLTYWKEFTRLYLSLFVALPDLSNKDILAKPFSVELPVDEMNLMLISVPPMKGSEYLTQESMLHLWSELRDSLKEEILEFGEDIPAYFSARHSEWNLLGRVCFHLAENKASVETPFAFMSTFAHQISKNGKTQHLPLSRAIEKFSGVKQRDGLLRLLSPLHLASQKSPFIKNYLDSGEIYHPLAWSAEETHQFLKDIPLFEKAGIAVRVPNWWKRKQPGRAQVTIRLGEKSSGGVGVNALLDFSMTVKVGEEELTEQEIRELLEKSDQLVFFKGQWIEVDQDKLKDILSQWKRVSKSVTNGSVTFSEGIRLLAGVGGKLSNSLDEGAMSQTRVISGAWLSETLTQIRSIDTNQEIEKTLRTHLKANLRPYQAQGVNWLFQLNHLRLGGILADDMGLGKTIQVISLLLVKKHIGTVRSKSLLAVPASLIGNWRSELDRFGPSLKYWIAHPSGDGVSAPDSDFDLVITTFGSLYRLAWLSSQDWDLILADEAQAIKNPEAKQTKAIKALKSHHRIAMTGTPVENHLSDLWSLFDFVSPGLIGTGKEFNQFIKSKKAEGGNPYPHLKQLVQPYILRRLKTDKSVIADLPDKTEMKTFCLLSKAQIALYHDSVTSLANDIEASDGIKRRGIVLSYLMRLKQICNHPSQFLKQAEYRAQESGKFLRLKEICEVIFERQEKVLVFTQFKELTGPLHDFLASIFNEKGLILNGDTAIKKRADMVEDFQKDDGPSFFILSLKAGGTGLNLTAASHVIHFDRWWNPAVENQATDRAFRIGQKNNVVVHKFVCQGTLEEKIDRLLESKQSLSYDLLEGGDGALLTELPNDELLKIVTLDINSISV